MKRRSGQCLGSGEGVGETALVSPASIEDIHDLGSVEWLSDVVDRLGCFVN